MSSALILALVFVAGLAFTFKHAGALTVQNDSGFFSIYERWGSRYGVDPYLLRAIAIVESNENPDAENPNDPSVGLMQILCMPDADGRCTNRFNIERWNQATWQRLHEPDFNVEMGAQILAWNIKTFGYLRGIAVYNAWSARTAPPDGPFPNQSYVDKVVATYTRLVA